MRIKAKMKLGKTMGKEVKSLKSVMEGDMWSLPMRWGEAKKKEKMPLAKQFDQAFSKLDTWFKSTKGLTPIGVISKSQLPKSQKFGNIGVWDLSGSIGSIWIWDFLLAPRRGAI